MTGQLDPDLQAGQRAEAFVSFDLSKISTEQLSLIFGQPVITVHCLFAFPHIVRHFDSQERTMRWSVTIRPPIKPT
jgi:hypothetical protein